MKARGDSIVRLSREDLILSQMLELVVASIQVTIRNEITYLRRPFKALKS
jgi:hypothetical protein